MLACTLARYENCARARRGRAGLAAAAQPAARAFVL